MNGLGIVNVLVQSAHKTTSSGLTCKLHHCSPLSIIIHHTYHQCTSFHRCIFHTTF